MTLLGIVLFVAAVVPTDALITSFVSQLLHLCLGIGAYLLPFFLVAIGASCLVRIDKEGIPLRASVGSAILFVAVLSLLALFAPEAAPDATDNLFLADQLSARGGYIGAGVAWCGLTLFGKVISAIVLFGLAIAGLIVIGFSVSSIVEKLRALAAAREEAEGASTAWYRHPHSPGFPVRRRKPSMNPSSPSSKPLKLKCSSSLRLRIADMAAPSHLPMMALPAKTQARRLKPSRVNWAAVSLSGALLLRLCRKSPRKPLRRLQRFDGSSFRRSIFLPCPPIPKRI